MIALRNIEDRFNRRLKYPYVVLTEATITEEIQNKADWITEGRATFGAVVLGQIFLVFKRTSSLISRLATRDVGSPRISR